MLDLYVALGPEKMATLYAELLYDPTNIGAGVDFLQEDILTPRHPTAATQSQELLVQRRRRRLARRGRPPLSTRVRSTRAHP
jgi:hypothetical protein